MRTFPKTRDSVKFAFNQGKKQQDFNKLLITSRPLFLANSEGTGQETERRAEVNEDGEQTHEIERPAGLVFIPRSFRR